MLFNLISTVIAGVAAAGAMMLVFRILGRKRPGWVIPITAGTAMLLFHIWNEYTWFERVSKTLPEEVAVAESYGYGTALQPWTLVWPRINRFTAIDRTSIRHNEKTPGYVMADILLVKRLHATAKATPALRLQEQPPDRY